MNPAEPLTRTFCITVPSLFLPCCSPGRVAPGPDLLGGQLGPESEPVPAQVPRNPAGDPEVGYAHLPVQPDGRDFGDRQAHPLGLSGQLDADLEARSEERRVGKECRSRWSPYH